MNNRCDLSLPRGSWYRPSGIEECLHSVSDESPKYAFGSTAVIGSPKQRLEMVPALVFRIGEPPTVFAERPIKLGITINKFEISLV